MVLTVCTSHRRGVTLPSQTLIFKMTKGSERNTAGNEEAGIRTLGHRVTLPMLVLAAATEYSILP